MSLRAYRPTMENLRDSHHGQDIYVLGSGASLAFIDRSFFDDKVCVAVNFVAEIYGLTRVWYGASHYHADTRELAIRYPGRVFVCPDHDTTKPGSDPVQMDDLSNVVTFPAGEQHYADFDVNEHWPPPDSLVIGSSSLHMAMHFAAHLGAGTIILVGADCGVLAGARRIEGYPDGSFPFEVWERHLRHVATKLRDRYGCGVHSLNPFVNFNLEGTPYVGVNHINP